MDFFRNQNKANNQIIDGIPLPYVKAKIIYGKPGDKVDFQILEVNSALEMIAGIKKEKLVGKMYSEVFPESYVEFDEHINFCLNSNKRLTHYSFEIYLKSQGIWLDIFMNFHPGDIITIVLNDCSQRKITEKKLMESEQRFKSLYENSTIGLYRTTFEGEVLMANPILVKILGYGSFEELAKRNLEKEGFSQGYSRKEFTKLFKNKDIVTGIESSWIRKDGAGIFITESARAIRDNEGDIVYFEGTVEDITDRKNAEKKIEELNKVFFELGIDPAKNIEILLKKTADIIDGEFSMYNRLSEDGTTISPISFYNIPADLVRKGTPAMNDFLVDYLRYGKEPFSLTRRNEPEVFKKNPLLEDLNINTAFGYPIIADGKPSGNLCVLCTKERDFSESEIQIIDTLAKALSLEQVRLDSLKDLIVSRKEAEEANKAKGQFLANMSHEIRTPLNGILGFSEILIINETDDQKRKMLKLIEQSGTHLLQIVEGLLDYSQIGAGRIKLHESNFKLSNIIKETSGFFMQKVKEKGIHLSLDLDEIYINEMFGDGFKLKQILANLLSNAIKFTDKGNVRIFATSNSDGKQVKVELAVEDTGIGIDPAMRETIFDEFKQLDYYLVKKSQGTGLGLTIAKKLVEMMGGSIGVEGEPGKGSRFIVDIDFKVKTNPGNLGIKKEYMNDYVDDREPDAGKIKILLAEDNEANQFLIKAITKSKDWDLTVVDDGEMAVEAYGKGEFDLILMDVQMPVMNGYEATKAIREMEKAKGAGEHIQIIALTAFAMKSDKDLCIEAGMDDYISKPFKRQQFLEKIINLLGDR
ncbi:MAG: response regulator [Chlorobi bacterium]|nr:response regulator [Chlorobiota bacterium]